MFLCGDGKFMAPAVRDPLIRIWMSQVGGDHAWGSEWLNGLMKTGRFHQDVFGFGK
ncbi:hypothetical protein [uncultured Sphingomonas sp.]|uniref:hypothetical protein n=1 Tax=uncultured Sphingomonas sp. TaxID=158754 RepID=UPI0035CC9317